MPIANEDHDKDERGGSGAIAGTFEVSVINGQIHLQALKEEWIELGDVSIAGESPETGDGLSVSAEIIAQAKGDKVVVFKKRRRHNYRRKKALRQQHTILRIVAVSEGSVTGKKAAPAEAVESDKIRKTSRSAAAGQVEEEAQLKTLAVDVQGGADRMGASLSRAIESVRAALDPEREIAARKRFETEFAGTGGIWLQGLT